MIRSLILGLVTIACLCDGVFAQKYISDKKLWSHVVALDRLTWSEQEGSDRINDIAEPAMIAKRLYLDILGRLPTYDEMKEYLESKEINKQQHLIEELLSSPGYALYFGEFWMDLLRIPHDEARSRFYSNHNAFHNYMRRSLHMNKPYDVLVQELINSKGTYLDNPAVGFYMRDILTNYMDTVNSSVRAFLGTRIGCAQCHNHRFDKWTQKEFYEASAYIHGTKASLFGNQGHDDIIKFHVTDLVKKGRLKPELVETYGVNRAVRNVSKAVVLYDQKKALTYPSDYRYENAKPGSKVKERIIFNYGDLKEIDGEDRRDRFSKWMASKENKVFSKMMANRLWKRYLGIGLMEPVDDWKDGNLINNPDLFKHLGEVFIEVNYDFKAFLSILFNSQAYMLQAHPKNEIIVKNYNVQGSPLRRMSAQQISNTFATFRSGKIEQYNRLKPIYFEFDDRIREIGVEFLSKYRDLHKAYVKQYKDDYSVIDPKISDLIYQQITKVNEAEDYYDMDKDGFLKNSVKLSSLLSKQKDKSKKGQGTMMTMTNKDKGSSSHHKTMTGAFQRSNAIKSVFGESDRSAPSNGGSEEPSSIQILKLMNDPVIKASVDHKSSLIKRMSEEKSFTDKLVYLYYSIYARKPSSKEYKIAKAFIVKETDLKLWSEFAHAMLSSPEFLFIQ